MKKWRWIPASILWGLASVACGLDFTKKEYWIMLAVSALWVLATTLDSQHD